MTAPRDRLRRQALSFIARLLPRPPIRAAGGRPARVLLVRPDHFGDVLLTSPAVAYLRDALPRAHLSLLVGPWSKMAASRGPEVDEILSCKFPGFTRKRKRHALEPYQVLLQEAGRLRDRYDIAVVFRPDHWWGALLAAVARVPIRIGWETPTTRPLLTEAVSLPARVHSVQLNLALATRVVEVVGVAGGRRKADGGGGSPSHTPSAPVFRVTEEERAWAAAFEHETRPLVLLHPGSGSPLKQWPAERWAAVADALATAGARVAITGGSDDLGGPRKVAMAMRSPPLLLAGDTSLGQLGALSERCMLALGTDSGPLHLAASLGTRTLRLYGPTDEAVFGPWGSGAKHVQLTNPLPCRPCGNIVSPPCGAHEEPPCMLGIEPGRVADAALAMLNTPP